MVKKINNSGFAITINSNREITNRPFANLFVIEIRDLLLSTKIIDFFTVESDKGWIHLDRETFKRLAGKMNIDGSFEVGGVMQRLHCHFTISFEHYAKVRVDVHRMRDYLEGRLKSKPFIGVPQIFGVSGTGQLRYMSKNFRGLEFRLISDLRMLNGRIETFQTSSI